MFGMRAAEPARPDKDATRTGGAALWSGGAYESPLLGLVVNLARDKDTCWENRAEGVS
jgi:hypothetical protein